MSTQFGVDFREMTVLTEASVHVGTFSGVATDKLRGQLIPLSVYRRKTQWLSAAAESRPKVRSWPSAEPERSPKQYTSLLSAPKPNFGRSLSTTVTFASVLKTYIDNAWLGKLNGLLLHIDKSSYTLTLVYW